MRVAVDTYRFRGATAPPLVASKDSGPWSSKLTKTGGSPTVLASGGAMVMTLDATEEAQAAVLYQGDIRPYDIDDLIRVEFLCKLTASLPAAVQAAFGLCSAPADDADSIATAALFKCDGSNLVKINTDDGTNLVQDGTSNATILSSYYKRFAIDFSSGNKSQSPPYLSLGGKADIHYYAGDDISGGLRRVGAINSHSLESYTGQLMLFGQVSKSVSTAEAALSIMEIVVEYKLSA